MGWKEAYYEVAAPDKQELEEKAKTVDNKIHDDSTLQKSINKIHNKINQSRTGVERDKLNEQLEEMEKLGELYQKYQKEKYTTRTNKDLKKLFTGIEEQISIDKNEIEDDRKKINTIMKEENENLTDTWNPFSDKTPRDHIEESINFIGEVVHDTYNETLEMTKFLELFTLEYINILNTKLGVEKYDLQKKVLYINKEELENILKKVGYELKESNFKISFVLEDEKKETIEFKKYTKNYIQSLETKEEINATLEPLKKLSELGFISETKIKQLENQDGVPLNALKQILDRANNDFKDEITKYQIAKGLIKDKDSTGAGNINGPLTSKNIELSYNIMHDAQENFTGEISKKLLQEEKKEGFLLGNFINERGIPEGTQNFGIHLIEQYLIGKKAYKVDFGNGEKKDIHITQEYIQNNKEIIVQNIGFIVEYILSVESHGGQKYAKNTDSIGWEKGSTAKGPFQILDGYKLGKLNEKYNREEGKFSTFEVALRYTKRVYQKANESIADYINTAYGNPGIISPLDLTSEQSINLFLTYLFKKSISRDAENHLIAAIATGNQYAIKKLYSEIHNTAVSNKTKQVMNRRLTNLAYNK